jgi:hypothetical protein
VSVRVVVVRRVGVWVWVWGLIFNPTPTSSSTSLNDLLRSRMVEEQKEGYSFLLINLSSNLNNIESLFSPILAPKKTMKMSYFPTRAEMPWVNFFWRPYLCRIMQNLSLDGPS